MYGATGGGAGSKIPKGYKEGRLQQFTPEQMQLFQQMFGHVGEGSYLSRLASGDQSLFEEMEKPALRQFSELQGGIASRFSQGGGGRGALSSRNSSGFQNTMNSATSDFAQNLQSKRQGLQQQAIKDLMGISGDLLGQRPHENYLIKEDPKKSFLEKIFGQGIFGGGGENMANALKIISLFM
jgi:hypothetical protein